MGFSAYDTSRNSLEAGRSCVLVSGACCASVACDAAGRSGGVTSGDNGDRGSGDTDTSDLLDMDRLGVGACGLMMGETGSGDTVASDLRCERSDIRERERSSSSEMDLCDLREVREWDRSNSGLCDVLECERSISGLCDLLDTDLSGSCNSCGLCDRLDADRSSSSDLLECRDVDSLCLRGSPVDSLPRPWSETDIIEVGNEDRPDSRQDSPQRKNVYIKDPKRLPFLLRTILIRQ